MAGSDEDTALLLACYFGSDNVATKLIQTFGESCNPQQADTSNKNALYYAFEKCSKDVVKLMLETYGESCVGKTVRSEPLGKTIGRKDGLKSSG